MTYDQTHWIPVQQHRPLPTFYYHEHFIEMLDFVGEHYAHVLLEQHIDFIGQFRQLPTDAQRLYVRLVNRKGRLFARNRLRYPELGELAQLLTSLRDQGWVGAPDATHFAELLGFLTRNEIYEVLLPHCTGLSRTLKKTELVEFALANVEPAAFTSALSTERILVQLRHGEIRYLMFLYFGRVQDSLSQFTMRDLGIVRTQSFHDSYEPRFTDRDEALECYFYASRLQDLKKPANVQLAALYSESSEWPEPNFPASAALRDDLSLKLGRSAEKTGAIEAALHLYQKGESADCSERTARILLANGSREAARQHLERCIDAPRSEAEWLIARDLYEQKFEKKRTSAITDALRAADTIDIDESRSGSPERAAIDFFESHGMAAFRTENLLWRTLFGLLFWEELFVEGDAALHSPFELLPLSLVNGTFYANNRERIEAKLALLDNPAQLRQQLLRARTANYGKPNGVFRWRQSMNDAVFALLDSASPGSIATILRRFCDDYANSRYGYPDLLVVDSAGSRFVEIKTAGDQLRRNQLLRIEQLRSAGFRADVVRINWVLDPDQVYVVVDVETTGGRGDNHRVTEIGAVKVRNGEIIDRFQTLLNPQRVIPPGIIRLTGISPAMVVDAPYFSDIADDFEAFMADAIFVAHNVEFDYGFIAAEFKRIGRPFRHAKLCTCASMRKLYPGHRSYSLAALCGAFDISLTQHHRALCDAEAAAELLLLINEKRQAA